MIGSIIGDVVGSFFEVCNTKSKDFELFSYQNSFTDDSVLTIATADWLLNGGPNAQFKQKQRKVNLREMNCKWLRMNNIS